MNLNEAQEKAVHATGPVLVLAGAGAGKTKTITSRVVKLIKDGVAPRKILAITFTNKAAQEMQERVRAAIAADPALARTEGENPWVSTFHAFCAVLLRENAQILGIPHHFSIYDRTDSKQILKDIMVDMGVDPKQIEPGKILSRISREKGNMLTPEDLHSVDGDYGTKFVATLWKRYDTELFRQKALDFDDLLVKTVRMLSKNPDLKTKYQERFEYIHVDEYQDTNKAQYELVRILAERHRNLFVVGDIDQTIYTWRGAHIKNLLHFEKDYPGTTVVLLEENYRSTKNIIDAANAVIKKNSIRYEKTSFTKNHAGDPLGVYSAYDENDEAGFVSTKIKELLDRGVAPGSIAVLYRANFQSRVLEQSLLEKQIPYQVLGTRFFERREVKNVLSFVRAALNRESLGDIKRIINVPPRGIGKLTLLKVLANKERDLNAGQQRKVQAFKELLSNIRTVALERKPSETIKFVIAETGIEKMFKAGSEEELERLENVKELVTLATQYDKLPPQEGIEKLLSDVALSSDQDELETEKKLVRLMTVHTAKGLEFDFVFITGLEEDLFPHHKPDAATMSLEEAEEERRLFYVALTRARKKIFLSYANVRTVFGNRQVNLPSEFLADIGEALWESELHTSRPSKTIFF